MSAIAIKNISLIHINQVHHLQFKPNDIFILISCLEFLFYCIEHMAICFVFVFTRNPLYFVSIQKQCFRCDIFIFGRILHIFERIRDKFTFEFWRCTAPTDFCSQFSFSFHIYEDKDQNTMILFFLFFQFLLSLCFRRGTWNNMRLHTKKFKIQ